MQSELFVRTKFRTKNTQVITYSLSCPVHLPVYNIAGYVQRCDETENLDFLWSASGQAQGQRSVLFHFSILFVRDKKRTRINMVDKNEIKKKYEKKFASSS